MRMQHVSIRLPSDLVDELRQEAKVGRCGMSEVVRRRLEGVPLGEFDWIVFFLDCTDHRNRYAAIAQVAQKTLMLMRMFPARERELRHRLEALKRVAGAIAPIAKPEPISDAKKAVQ